MARIRGTRFNDNLRGTGFGDRIDGLQGNDHLTGRGGNDKLHGGSGRDLIFGGTGHDKLSGGSGPDVFKFNAGDGGFSAATGQWDDVITDYVDGVDHFDVPVASVTGVAISDFIAPTQGGAGAEVAYFNGAGQLVGSFFVVGYSSLIATLDDFI